MKISYLFALGLVLCLTNSVLAQKNKVQSAIIHQRYGEWDKAKEAIDAAAENPASNTMAKTWLYKGSIYLDLYEKDTTRKLCADPLPVAIESFAKCKSLDEKKDYEAELMNFNAKALAYAYNQGIKMYNLQDYNGAIASFQLVEKGVPNDTNVLYNIALAADKSKNTSIANTYFNRLIALNYRNASIYQMLANNYKNAKDTTAALAVLDKGRTAFPNNVGLIIDELNIYLKQGRQAEAIGKLENALKLTPDDPSLYFALGVSYENTKNSLKAEENYKKAIEKNANYFDANYNLGAMYFNEGATMVSEANKIPVNESKKYEEAKKKYIEKFKQALPFLEKAHQLEPKDINTVFSLKQLYAKIDNTEKTGEFTKKYNQLKGK